MGKPLLSTISTIFKRHERQAATKHTRCKQLHNTRAAPRCRFKRHERQAATQHTRGNPLHNTRAVSCFTTQERQAAAHHNSLTQQYAIVTTIIGISTNTDTNTIAITNISTDPDPDTNTLTHKRHRDIQSHTTHYISGVTLCYTTHPITRATSRYT
jgi:hypothetical protein